MSAPTVCQGRISLDGARYEYVCNPHALEALWGIPASGHPSRENTTYRGGGS